MAKRAVTGISVARTVEVGGRRKRTPEGRVELTVEIDGRSSTTLYCEATHQEAIYVATVKALRRSHADGVTDLTVKSPNKLVEGHIEKGWERRESRLKDFQDDIEALKDKFDNVTWC